jgi:hypothetical protein
MSLIWSLTKASGYLASQSSPISQIATGALVYVAGYSNSSYNGVGTTWFDLSGSGNNMTISNATWDSVNKAFNFNGSNSYITTPNIYSQLLSSNAAINQTQEVWFKATSGSVVSEQNAISSPSWYDTQIELVSTAVKMRYWNLSSPYVTAGTNDSSKWMYACVRYNGATSQIDGNFNGSFVAAQSFTRTLTPSPAALYFVLGVGSGTNMGSGTYLNGAVAVYRTYRRALTNAEITQNYNAEKKYYGY